MSKTEDGLLQSHGGSLKAIVFDMDGTLVSSLSLIHHCESEISQKFVGRGLTLEEVISKFGPPARTIIREITASLSAGAQNRAVNEYYDCYSRNVPGKVLVFPGIPDLLERIRNSGKRLGLMTGVEKVMMQFTLKPFGLNAYFEELVTADDVERGKPDPEGILLALKRLGARPKESIYVGDSPADIIAGKQAGVTTGAALWSPENRGDPTTENPDYEFRSVHQLEDFLFPRPKPGQEPYFGTARTVREP